jgi:uncharacterized protein (TIGR03067 family)
MDKELAEAKVVFTGDELTVKTAKKEEKGRFRIGAAKKPKAIDLLGREKDQVALRIYQLDGSTLKLCWDQQSKAKGRPTEFATKKDTDQHLLVRKRQK